ncbi:unnamed protein product [Closterium sp. NIES-54]
MDVWGPACVSGQGRERYFLLVVDDYTRYTMVFPLRSKGEIPDVLIPWIRAVRLQLRKRFCAHLHVLRLHFDRGGEFSSDLLREFCHGEGVLQSFTLPASPQQNGIAERRIGLVMEVARASMIHMAAPHFLWPFAVWYAAPSAQPLASCLLVGDLAYTALDGEGWRCVGVPVSCPASPVRAVRTGRRVPRPRPPPVPCMHHMALCPSSVPLRVPLPSPLASSLADGPDLEFDLVRAASPTVPRLLASVFTNPSFESAAASALVAELVDFAAACRLDYAASLVVESESVYPPSVGGESALGSDVLEDRQEDFECFVAAVPHLVYMLIAPEGDLDALDIPTPRSYAEAITSPYSSPWQTAMDAEMASWKSTGTYVDGVPPTRANIVDGMWTSRVKRLPGSPPAFKARYIARGFNQRQGAPREWHDTLRTTLAALGFVPYTADPSLFLRTDTSLPLFYVLVYVDNLVFAIADTEVLALVKSELQKRHTCTDLGELRSYLGLQITWERARRTITLPQSHMVHQVLQRFGFRYSSPQSTPLHTGHLLSAPPSDESIEPSGPYPKLVGCLMYLMTCTRPGLAYPLSILARYVATGRHGPEHWEAAKRVLRYLCSTSGMALVLGGRGPVVLTGHADAS